MRVQLRLPFRTLKICRQPSDLPLFATAIRCLHAYDCGKPGVSENCHFIENMGEANAFSKTGSLVAMWLSTRL